jgi:hypothetical protein
MLEGSSEGEKSRSRAATTVSFGLVGHSVTTVGDVAVEQFAQEQVGETSRAIESTLENRRQHRRE